MRKGWRQRYLYHFSAIGAGLLQDCFKRRISCNKGSAVFSVNVSAQSFKISLEPSPSKIWS